MKLWTSLTQRFKKFVAALADSSSSKRRAVLEESLGFYHAFLKEFGYYDSEHAFRVFTTALLVKYASKATQEELEKMAAQYAKATGKHVCDEFCGHTAQVSN